MKIHEQQATENATFRQNNIPLVLQYFQYRPIL